MEHAPNEDDSGALEATPEPGTPEVSESVDEVTSSEASGTKETPAVTGAAVTEEPASIAAPVSGGLRLKLVALLVGGAMVLAVAGGSLILVLTGESDGDAENVEEVATPGTEAGFVLGDLSANEAIESIFVTLKIGAEGKDLDERVDLHLGTGFPLRLFPLGSNSRDPAFAAYPQKSSLEAGATSIAAGEGATFAFAAKGEDGEDLLSTSPQLLRDLTVGDLTVIGFSSLGESDWILEGYRIEVNGKLFAENDSVNAQPGVSLGEVRKELASRKPESDVLLGEISELKAFLSTGLGDEQDTLELAAKEAELKEIAGPLNLLAGQGAGYFPWYVEKNEKLLATTKGAGSKSVGEVGVRLIAGGGDQPGTRNPLYLMAGGKKFLLTSEVDPFADLEEPQDFTLSLSDLENNPLKREELDKVGIGIIGNEARFGPVPDRAKLQRVVVTIDGEEVYDSEKETTDRRALQALWLVPPVHFDSTGGVVRNEEKPGEKHFWVTGTEAPAELPGLVLPEPLTPPFTGLTGIGGPGTPGALPQLAGGTPGALPGLTGATPGALPGLPGATTGAPPGLAGIGGPGTTTAPPGLAGATPGFPSGGPGLPGPGGLNPGLNPGAPPSFHPQTGGGGPGGGGAPGAGGRTAITGPIAGSFAPGGPVDPATGLIRGNFQRTNSNGFTPIRSGGSNGGQLGGLNPAVFNQPAILGKNPRVFSQTDIDLLATAILNALKPTPATPTTQNPKAPPTIGTVGFPNSVSGVEIGRKSTVDWTVLGDAAGMGEISSFRIDLMPVLPHLSPPTPSGSKPLASTSADANSRTVSVPAIQLPAAGFPGVAKTDLALLCVKPVVTALDEQGKTIGTAKDGPILPLFPDPLTYKPHGVRFSLFRGISEKPSDDPSSQLGGSFQMIPAAPPAPAVAPPNTSWKALGLARPGTGVSNIASMIGFTEEPTLAGLRFAPTEIEAPFLAFNTAARTKGGDIAVLIYEGGITYPAMGGNHSPAGKSGVAKGYRLVGHLGFLAGSAGGAGTANVQMRVELSGAGKTFAPVIVRNLNGDHLVDQKLEKSAWYRLETSAPIVVKQTAGGPMQELDIPISFEALDKGIGAVYPASRPVASFGSVPKGSNFVTPANHLTAPMAKVDFDAYEAAKKNGASYGVTVTIMVDTSASPASDTLGIFGLRLVPDVY